MEIDHFYGHSPPIADLNFCHLLVKVFAQVQINGLED